jgi:hypothetical protein
MDNTGTTTQDPNVPAGLDPTAFYLTKAIKQTETGGSADPYNTKGASGEFGAYQYEPSTWKADAAKYLGDANAPMTPENQNKAAYMSVKSLLDSGLTQSQVASVWNSGNSNPLAKGVNGVGTNDSGVAYDVPGYVNKVKNAYMGLAGGTTTPQNSATSSAQLPNANLPGIPQPGQTGALPGIPTSPNTGTATPTQPAPDASTTFDSTAAQQGPKGFLGTLEGIVPFGKLAEKLGDMIAGPQNQQTVNDSMNMLLDQQNKVVGAIQTAQEDGKDTTQLKASLKQLQQTIQSLSNNSDAIINGDVTAKQEVGSAVSGLGMLAGGAELEGASLLTKALAGAASGYAVDVGTNLEDNKGPVTGKDFTPGLATAIGTTLPFAGALIKGLLKTVGGFAAGTGEEVIQRAIDNPDAVGAAVKEFANNPQKTSELVQTADDALTSFKQKMTTEYGSTLSTLQPAADQAAATASSLAEQEFKNAAKGWGVELKEVVEPEEEGVIQTQASAPKFQPDFTNSSLDAEQQDAVTQAWNKIQGWKDNSPAGFDQLRRYLNGSGSDFLMNVGKKFKDGAETVYPGFKDMVDNYAQRTNVLNTLKREISSVTGNVSDQTKLNKIMKIFKKDPLIRSHLVTAMGQQAADDFLNKISGAILSSWVPAGGTGKFIRGASELAGVGGAMLHGVPGAGAAAAGTAAAGFAATSPRIVGGLARIMGSRTGATLGGAAASILKRGAAKVGNPLIP